MSRLINLGLPFVGSASPSFGLSSYGLRRAIAEGAVRRVFAGIYVDATVPESRSLRIDAVRLVLPPHAVLCGSTAAWLLGVDTFPPGRRFDFVPECLVPVGASRVRHRLVRAREAVVDPRDVMEIDGVRLTRPLRITADVLRRYRRPYALSAADVLAHAELVDLDELVDYLPRLRGYRGIVQARSLAPLIEPLAESPGESWQRLRLLDAGLPRPVAQFVVRDHDGRFVARLDHAYPKVLAAAEFDGREFHSSGRDVARDAARRAYLREQLGWRLEVSTNNDVLGTDARLERIVAGWLGVHPSLPRNW